MSLPLSQWQSSFYTQIPYTTRSVSQQRASINNGDEYDIKADMPGMLRQSSRHAAAKLPTLRSGCVICQ